MTKKKTRKQKENKEEVDSENKEEVVKQNEPNKAEKTAKKGSRIQGIKTEFARIIWPDKDTIIKETTAVVVVTAILGAVIAALFMFFCGKY